MPYFKWVGVDIVGSTKKGKQAAHSSQDLSDHLLQCGIALLWCKSVYAPSFLWPVHAQLKAHLFQQKAKLLQAGLLLPQALTIIAQQSYNPIVYDMLHDIGADIQQGVSFHTALDKHNKLSDPMVKVMLSAGYESGNVINAMQNVAHYFYQQYQFNKKIRSVLAMPVITLLFFIGISLFIFVCIIPRFADMFSSFQQELPALTRTMIKVSDYVCSFSMIYTLAIGGTIVFCIYRYAVTIGKQTCENAMVYMPFIGNAIWQHHMGQALQALALLVNSGVTLVTGLSIISESVDHSLIKMIFTSLHHDVAAGQLLSKAMISTVYFLPEVVGLVIIGEESGTLGQALESASSVYNNNVEEYLKRFIFFLQPIVIIILGCLVAILIFAVYLPIMQLSHVL